MEAFEAHSAAPHGSLESAGGTLLRGLEGLGAYVSRERAQHGMSLEQVSVVTRIPVFRLQALERGEVEAAYVPFFVKAVGSALRLDPTDVLRHLEDADVGGVDAGTSRQTSSTPLVLLLSVAAASLAVLVFLASQ